MMPMQQLVAPLYIHVLKKVTETVRGTGQSQAASAQEPFSRVRMRVEGVACCGTS